MKTQNPLTRSGASRAIKGLIATLGLVAGTAAFAAEPIGKVGVLITGEEFGPGKEIHRNSGGKRIVPATEYTYRLSGKVTSQPGTALAKALGANGTSIDAFVESLKAGSSSRLGGSYTNTGGKLPATVINETISGTKTITGIGKIKISFTIVGKIDNTGVCSVDVTNVTFKSKPKLTPAQRKALGTIKFKAGSKLQFNATPTVTFKRANNPVVENAGQVVVPVWRDTNRHGAVTLTYTTEDITATSADYEPKTGTVDFADGVTEGSITIVIKDNAINDSNRTFKIKLIDPITGAILGASTETMVTITDND
jgi:hypothetical protein